MTRAKRVLRLQLPRKSFKTLTLSILYKYANFLPYIINDNNFNLKFFSEPEQQFDSLKTAVHAKPMLTDEQAKEVEDWLGLGEGSSSSSSQRMFLIKFLETY